MSERRTSARQKSFMHGRILFNNRQSAVDCLIRDVSEHGAKLIFSDTAGIPEAVDLYIPYKDQTMRAHVQWRHGEEVGVAFGAAGRAPAPSPGVAELAERVEQLETEVASLRRMLKRLKGQVAAGAEPDAA
jgi:hypothetical protein